MKALSGVDGAFLHLETQETPMHVASLHRFDLPRGYRGDFHTNLKRQIAARLHLAPIFTRKLAPMPLQFANPVWIEEDEVDLGYHVPRVSLPSPGTQRQFEDCAARLHSELLDRGHPLWRVYVIDGLQMGQVGLYIKVHHAVLDGLAGVALAKVLFDVEPQPPRIRRRAQPPAEHPSMIQLAAAALKHDAGQYFKLLRSLPDAVRTVVSTVGSQATRVGGGTRSRLGKNFSFGPKTPLNVPITGERGFAAVSVPLETLKQVAIAHDAKVNDVVLAMCSGALRRYLAHHGGIPRKPLIATMPISLRAAGNAEYTTQAMLTLVNLSTHIADPLKRLHAIRDAAGAMKALVHDARGVITTDFPSIGVPWLLQGLAKLYGRSGIAGAIPPIANVVISNVPGPQVPLYAAGARMATYWPVSITEHGVGLNITVLSYDGAMGFGFTTAHSAVPDARELSTALEAAIAEIVTKGRSKAARKKPLRAAASSPSG
jgi:WS/DGAT/MGAT family acyltransferase